MRLLLIALLPLAAACTSGAMVRAPETTPRPAPQDSVAQAGGAIYNNGVQFRPLFEDRRARYVGDSITIQINEKTQASRQADGLASRDASVAFGVPVVQGLPGKSLQGAALNATAASKLESKEATSANNLFNGSIAVTVTEVLPNGNLVVAGEKRIGINGEIEKLRFSGTVNPQHIAPGNVVSSAHVADARIESASHSHVEGEQIAGFLSRFFVSFIPFR
jgi:flagellar L-ring protein precursor FlgH